jgi:hypothetical protein
MAIFAIAGCTNDPISQTQPDLLAPSSGAPSAVTFSDDDFLDELAPGTFTVCKVAEGSTMKFTFNTTAEGPGVATAPVYEPVVMLGNGECADVYVAPAVEGSDTVTITEDLPEGYQVDRVAIWSLDVLEDGTEEVTFHEYPAGTTEVQGAISAGKLGCVVIFYNSEIPEECTGRIGDFVWNDAGGTKGIQDEGEVGIPNVTVTLKDAQGTVIETVVTDENGFYLFDELCAGDYQVCVDETTIPEGWMQTPTEVGEDRCIDNNPNPAMVTLPEDNTKDLCIDFGYMEPAEEGPGTGTPGYWHKPERWPVDTIDIGGTTYTKEEATMYLTGGTGGDKSINMFRHLVAAKLNVMIGNESGCIDGTIEYADDWMADYPVGSGVRASSDAWDEGGWAKDELDDYNNGRLCAEKRD